MQQKYDILKINRLKNVEGLNFNTTCYISQSKIVMIG